MSDREPSPWIAVPAADYECHMASPQVGQVQFSSAGFAAALALEYAAPAPARTATLRPLHRRATAV